MTHETSRQWIPCGVSWCVALTEKQFCPIHEKNQTLHPAEVNTKADVKDAAYAAGYADGYAACDAAKGRNEYD